MLTKGSHIRSYIIGEKIGNGSFGIVYIARHVITNRDVAIKVVNKSSIRREENFREEINILNSAKHPFIVGCLEHFETDLCYYLVMEYVCGGNLSRILIGNHSIGEPRARKYFIQIALALQYCHEMLHISHNDVKPSNVMLDENDNVRLIDFGLSQKFSTENPFMTNQAGSLLYCAPEIINRKKYTAVVDVWSLGVILFQMVTGILPFDAESAESLRTKINNKPLMFPDFVSIPCQDFIMCALMKDPNERATIDELLKHSWALAGDSNEIAQRQIALFDRITENSDEGILNLMASYGIDVKILKENKNMEISAVYEQIMREKITSALPSVNPSPRRQTAPVLFPTSHVQRIKTMTPQPKEMIAGSRSSFSSNRIPPKISFGQSKFVNVPPPCMIGLRRPSRNAFDFKPKCISPTPIHPL